MGKRVIAANPYNNIWHICANFELHKKNIRREL